MLGLLKKKKRKKMKYMLELEISLQSLKLGGNNKLA